ncbi:MAG TPA: DUF6084 family protein [Bryobacteraceae bacterium]|jgi:hypothetical protein
MPDLSFQVTGAAPVELAAVPTLGLTLVVKNSIPDEVIHSAALRCQVQLEVTRRNYTPEEKKSLTDLFGEPGRWGQTLRPMLWTHAQATVPSFTASVSIEMQIPCTFDFNIAATKYFYGLEEGDVPLCLMFSGTIYQIDEAGAMLVSPVPWDREARYRLPVQAWRDMMDEYYPNTAWMCLQRDMFDRLYQYKVQHGIATWELAFDRLLREGRKVATA